MTYKWATTPVCGRVMIPHLAETVKEELDNALRDATSILSERYPDPFPLLPEGIFYVEVVLGWPGIRADVQEIGLYEHLPKGTSYFSAAVASSAGSWRLSETSLTSGMLVDAISKLPDSVKNAWPGWLAARQRRRYRPEWLKEFKRLSTEDR